jgi:hypothetical protein
MALRYFLVLCLVFLVLIDRASAENVVFHISKSKNVIFFNEPVEDVYHVQILSADRKSLSAVNFGKKKFSVNLGTGQGIYHSGPAFIQIFHRSIAGPQYSTFYIGDMMGVVTNVRIHFYVPEIFPVVRVRVYIQNSMTGEWAGPRYIWPEYFKHIGRRIEANRFKKISF